MPPIRTSKISNEEWEKQKPFIEGWLQQEKGPGNFYNREELISYMSRCHGFNASISQYEARLQHWNLRKNLNTDDWVLVAKTLEARKSQDRQSEVYVSGKLLTDAQVRKGISRQTVREAISQRNQEEFQPIPWPPYLRITSPKIRAEEDEGIPENNSISLEDSIESRQIRAGLLGHEETYHTETPSLLEWTPIEAVVDHGQIESDNCTSSEFNLCESQIGLSHQLWPGLGDLDLLSWKNSIEESTNLTRSKIRKRLKNSIPSNVLFSSAFRQWVSSVLVTKSSSVVTLLDFNTISDASLSAIVPQRYSSNLADMTQGASLLHLAICELVSNSRVIVDLQFPYIHDNLPSDIVRWALSFLQNQPSQFFRKLPCCLPRPFSESLYRNLLYEAVLVGAFKVVQGLLTTSLIPAPEMIFWFLRYKHGASLLANLLRTCPGNMVKFILGLLDKEVKRSLVRNMAFEYRSHDLRIENATILFSEGFDISWVELVEGAIISSNLDRAGRAIDLVPFPKHKHLLPDHNAVVNIQQNISSSVSSHCNTSLLVCAIRYLSEEDALKTVQIILQDVQLNQTSILKYDKVLQLHIRSALCVAIAREYCSLIDFLMGTDIPADVHCLYEAVCVKRVDLIETLISQGISHLDVMYNNHGDLLHSRAPNRYKESVSHLDRMVEGDHQCYHSLRRRGKNLYATPYAQAIRMQYNTAIEIFGRQPVMDLEALRTLIDAASEVGDEVLLERFLESLKTITEKENQHLREEIRRTFLTEAVLIASRHGHRRVLDTLFRAGADPPPLELFKEAMHSRNYARIAFLFENSSFAGHSTGSSSCDHIIDIIMTATAFEDCELLSFVLECVDIDSLKALPGFLNYAITRDCPTILQAFLTMGIGLSRPHDCWTHVPWDLPNEINEAFVRDDTRNPIALAIQNGNSAIVDLLLQNNVWLNYPVFPHEGVPPHQWASPLRAAVALRDFELVRGLLAKGADPYDTGIISDLTDLRDWKTLDMVLEAGKRHNGGSKTTRFKNILTDALDSEDTETIRRLSSHANLDELCHISRRFLPNKSFGGYTSTSVLGYAISLVNDHLSSLAGLRILLQAGCDLEAACYRALLVRKTPLNYAVFRNSIPCVDILVEYHAPINRPATNMGGRTTLQFAAELGHYEMVCHLISLDADINAPAAHVDGLTALQAAAKGGFYAIAEHLIKKGADPDARGGWIHGRTALEAATEYGRLDVMLLLVRNGAGLAMTDRGNQFDRAIELATARGETPAVELAKDLKAKVEQARSEVDSEFFLFNI